MRDQKISGRGGTICFSSGGWETDDMSLPGVIRKVGRA